MVTKVLSIDPGRTTGLCQATIENGFATLMPWQEKLEVQNLIEVLDMRLPDIIIIERFDFRKESREGLDLFPKELIGIARYHSTTHHSEWYEQLPAVGMGYWNDKMLKKANVYLAGLPHAMDAMRHFLHWFTFGAGYKLNNQKDEYPFKLVKWQDLT